MPTPPSNHLKSVESFASPEDPIVPRSRLLNKHSSSPMSPIGQHLFSNADQLRSVIATPEAVSRPTFSAIVASGTKTSQQVNSDSPPSKHDFLVSKPMICVSNIPWDLTTKEVYLWLKKYEIAEFGIHILMNRTIVDALCPSLPGGRTLGKTLPNAFIELVNDEDVDRIVIEYHKSVLKNRQIAVKRSNAQELMASLFPNWDRNDPRIYLSRAEITALVTVCKNYKMHFSRKCADRSFENIISIISNVPWKDPNLTPTTLHRDHLFEMLKVSIDALRMHLSKEYYHVSRDLMERMVSVGVKCPGFTERQKLVMLQAAGIECPPHLTDYLEQSAGSIYDTARSIVSLETEIASPSSSVANLSINEDSPIRRFQPTSDLLKDHEEDILSFYQKELGRWQAKYRALEDRFSMVLAKLNEYEK